MVEKYKFGKERHIKRINDIREWWNSAVWRKKGMSGYKPVKTSLGYFRKNPDRGMGS